jgi:hypothetical protein
MWPQWLTDPLTGKTSLARAFWLYGLGGSILFSALGALLSPESTLGVALYFAAAIVLGLLQSFILWRCAFNSRSAFLGGIIRASVVGALIGLSIAVYLIFRNPVAAS